MWLLEKVGGEEGEEVMVEVVGVVEEVLRRPRRDCTAPAAARLPTR